MLAGSKQRLVRLYFWLLAPSIVVGFNLILPQRTVVNQPPGECYRFLAKKAVRLIRQRQCAFTLTEIMSQSNEAAAIDESLGSKRRTDQVEDSAISKKATSKDALQAAAAVEFARLLGGLKVTPRTGWVRRGVPKYESVADHSWRVAALSLLLPCDFDVSRCMAMAVVHDVAESLIGDICPGDNVSKEEKRRMEAQAMEKIASTLGQACVSSPSGGDSDCNHGSVQKLMGLVHEYEKRESKEAISVKDLDLLDMIVQASEYEERFGLDLSEFFEGTPASRFRTLELQKVAQEVHDQRDARIQAEEIHDVGNQVNEFSKSDAAFVAEYSKASNMSNEDVQRVVKALRTWEKLPKGNS